jgi:hypothetical protein
MLTSLKIQTRLGRKFVDEAGLLPLLLAHGLVRRVRIVLVEARPLGGDSFKVTLGASKPAVGEAKAEVARSQGTAESCQELYRERGAPAPTDTQLLICFAATNHCACFWSFSLDGICLL